jgi:hypothetical protein
MIKNMYCSGINLRKDKDKSSWLGVKSLGTESSEIHTICEDVNIPITPAHTQIPIQGQLVPDTSPQVLSTDFDTDMETHKVSSVATDRRPTGHEGGLSVLKIDT